MQTRSLSIIATSAIAIALSACGGGGSSSTPVAVQPTASLSQEKAVAAVGQAVTFSWSSNAASCTGSGLLAGELSSSGIQTVTLLSAGTVTTSVTCGGLNKSVSTEVLPQYTTIPDAVFEQALVSMSIDDNVDGKVLTANALATTSMCIDSGAGYSTIYCSHFTGTQTSYIQSVAGLENLRNLTYLRLEEQQVVDVSAVKSLTGLTYLSLWGNPITSIDLSKNTQLQTLGLSETSMTTVDVSALTKLEEVDFQQKALSDFGVSVPYVRENGTVVTGFTSLDLSHNAKLTQAFLSGNRLTALDLSLNSMLSTLWANDNQLTSVNIAGTAAASGQGTNRIDVSNNSLTQLKVGATLTTFTSWCVVVNAPGNGTLGQCDLGTASAVN